MQREMVDNPAVVPSFQSRIDLFQDVNTQKKGEGIALRFSTLVLDAISQAGGFNIVADDVMNLSEAFHQKVDITKRVIDLVGSLVLIALLSPVFVITVFAILIESGPPMIFKQKRSLCRGGRSFDFYKFRSMVHGADGMKGHLQKYNESDGALFKIKNDPRITRVGKIIRRLSIDELPQLFNVLKGDMSLVGPRPLPVSDLERIQEDWNILRNMKARARAKPGVTGLWQVCGRSALGFNTMIKLDLYYIENQSFLLDMKILLRTIPAVLRGDGAC